MFYSLCSRYARYMASKLKHEGMNEVEARAEAERRTHRHQRPADLRLRREFRERRQVEDPRVRGRSGEAHLHQGRAPGRPGRGRGAGLGASDGGRRDAAAAQRGLQELHPRDVERRARGRPQAVAWRHDPRGRGRGGSGLPAAVRAATDANEPRSTTFVAAGLYWVAAFLRESR